MTRPSAFETVGKMDFTVLTIFPEMVNPFLEFGIIRRALEQEKITVSSINIRDFARDKHRVTDDKPYGGGCGMVMKPEPLSAAIGQAKTATPDAKTILLTPQGRPFTRDVAHELATLPGMILVCGRYEGIDDRVGQNLIDAEISIGDYVLTGGELAAMVIIDAVSRLIPGILGGDDSADKESFENGLLEHAQFTRPRNFEGDEVPDVLVSGNHEAIDLWRLESSLMRTLLRRPELLKAKPLSKEEKEILKKWGRQIDTLIQV